MKLFRACASSYFDPPVFIQMATGGVLTPVGSTDYGHLVEWTSE